MTLVVLPGTGCSPRMWAGALPGTEVDVEKVLHPRLERDSVDGCVDDLLERLPDVVDLVGLSFGGIVAMALVRRAPWRVRRLCLMATNARGPVPAQHEAWAAQRKRLAAGETPRALQRDLLPLLLHDRSRAGTALLMAEEVGAAAWDAQLAAQSTRVDERPGLAKVAVPTLVVAPGEDRLCPLDRHEEIHALVPGSRLEVLDGVGHLAPLEAPERVALLLADWLARPAV